LPDARPFHIDLVDAGRSVPDLERRFRHRQPDIAPADQVPRRTASRTLQLNIPVVYHTLNNSLVYSALGEETIAAFLWYLRNDWVLFSIMAG
jgi:hypothetical protein